jgi:hypothetical protein
MPTKIKGYLIAAGALVLVIMIGLGIYGAAEHKSYLISKGKAEALTTQFNEYEKQAQSQIASLTAQGENWKDATDAALSAAAAAGKQTAVIQAALEAEKARTKLLTADLLAGQINARIGINQLLPIASGSFSLTRPGAENTLNIFLDGEGYYKKLQAESLVSENLRSAVNSSQHDNDTLGQRLTIRETELTKSVAAWDATKETLGHLEKSILGTKIKSWAVGIGTGAVAVIVLHLLKII